MIEPFQVLNGTGTVLIQYDNPVISIFLVLVTLTGILLAFWTSNRSNELVQKELKTKIRPWVIIKDLDVTDVRLKNNITDSYNNVLDKGVEKKNYVSIFLTYEIHNVGSAPSTEIHVETIHKDYDIERKEIEEKNKENLAIMPGESYFDSIKISADEFFNRISKPRFFVIQCTYKIDHNMIGIIGKKFKMDEDIEMIDNWYFEKTT